MLFVPFWWVGSTPDEGIANMMEKKFHDMDTNISFTCLVNSKALSMHEKLFIHKPKQEVLPLSKGTEASSSASKRKRLSKGDPVQ